MTREREPDRWRARRAAGAQTPPLLQPGTDARAQNEDGSGGCGHFAASSPPRKRHRVAKPTSPRAPGTLRRQMTQIWASYVHARVPNGPRNRHGRKNDCQGVSIWSSWGLMVSCASHTPGIGQGIVLNRKHPKPLVSKARMGTIRLKCHAFEREKCPKNAKTDHPGLQVVWPALETLSLQMDTAIPPLQLTISIPENP